MEIYLRSKHFCKYTRYELRHFTATYFMKRVSVLEFSSDLKFSKDFKIKIKTNQKRKRNLEAYNFSGYCYSKTRKLMGDF